MVSNEKTMEKKLGGLTFMNYKECEMFNKGKKRERKYIDRLIMLDEIRWID